MPNEDKMVKCWLCGKDIKADEDKDVGFVHDCGGESRAKLRAIKIRDRELDKIGKELDKEQAPPPRKSIFGGR